MFKKLNKKGFTLAELLVVVAIIGVLVAISIPIFTSQLEKSRDAVTLANLRAAYAEAQTAYLTKGSAADTTTGEETTNGDHTVTVKKATSGYTVAVTNVASKGQVAGLDNADQLPFTSTSLTGKESMGGTADKWTVTFTYDTDGKITGVNATK